MILILLCGPSASGKSTFIKKFIDKKGENKPTYLVNYISSDDKSETRKNQIKKKLEEESDIPKGWKRIGWHDVNKLKSCNIIFEDLICMNNRERNILLTTLNHQSHHKKLNIVCCVVHRLLTTGAFGLKKYFTYHVFTRDITNIECYSLCLKKFVTNSKEADSLLNYFSNWCKRGKFGVLVWHSKLLRFIPENQIRSTVAKNEIKLGRRRKSLKYNEEEVDESEEEEEKEEDEEEEQSETDSDSNESDFNRSSEEEEEDDDSGEDVQEDEEKEDDSRLVELLNSVHPEDKAHLLFNVIFKGLNITLEPPDFSFAVALRQNAKEEEAEEETMQRLGAITYIYILLSPDVIPSLKYSLFHKYITQRLELPACLILNRFLLNEYHHKQVVCGGGGGESNEIKESKRDKKEEKKIVIVHNPVGYEQFIWGNEINQQDEEFYQYSKKKNKKKKKKNKKNRKEERTE